MYYPPCPAFNKLNKSDCVFRIGQDLDSVKYMYYSRSEFSGVHVLPNIRIQRVHVIPKILTQRSTCTTQSRFRGVHVR